MDSKQYTYVYVYMIGSYSNVEEVVESKAKNNALEVELNLKAKLVYSRFFPKKKAL